MLTREKEALATANEDLEHELDMYKSVAVPVGHKPRTNMTRVGRTPLLNLLNLSEQDSRGRGRTFSPTDELEPIPGDMTVDELS